jgi:threonyl-tRNA synthetase
MVHRALFGSVERFVAMLIEHYTGAFPFWLAPVQALIVPVTDDILHYAQTVKKVLAEADVRVELDLRSERMQAKIRDAQNAKIPYIVVIGRREAKTGEIALRKLGIGDMGTMSLGDFIALAQEENRKAVPQRIVKN